MKGLEIIRLSFFVNFLSNLSSCAPAYDILQNIMGKLSLSGSTMFRWPFRLDEKLKLKYPNMETFVFLQGFPRKLWKAYAFFLQKLNPMTFKRTWITISRPITVIFLTHFTSIRACFGHLCLFLYFLAFSHFKDLAFICCIEGFVCE